MWGVTYREPEDAAREPGGVPLSVTAALLCRDPGGPSGLLTNGGEGVALGAAFGAAAGVLVAAMLHRSDRG